MHSVMLLIVSFGALAGLYVLLDAPFTAVTQIIIYAGAIMVLFLFVVMLLNVPREEPAPPAIAALLGPTGMRIGAVLSVLLGVEIVWALSRLGDRLVRAAAVGDVGQLGGAHRQRPVHAARVRVRGDVDPDPRRDGRRRRPGAEGSTDDGAAEPLPDALGHPVRDRHGRRVPAPQPDHGAALDRDHAERGEPDVRRGRPLSRDASTARSSRSSS